MKRKDWGENIRGAATINIFAANLGCRFRFRRLDGLGWKWRRWGHSSSQLASASVCMHDLQFDHERGPPIVGGGLRGAAKAGWWKKISAILYIGPTLAAHNQASGDGERGKRRCWFCLGPAHSAQCSAGLPVQQQASEFGSIGGLWGRPKRLASWAQKGGANWLANCPHDCSPPATVWPVVCGNSPWAASSLAVFGSQATLMDWQTIDLIVNVYKGVMASIWPTRSSFDRQSVVLLACVWPSSSWPASFSLAGSQQARSSAARISPSSLDGHH